MGGHVGDGQVAESSSTGALTPVVHKVWTFLVKGGEPFELTMPRTPALEHDGKLTLWKMVGSERAADAIRALLEETGATVEVHTEHQTPEQTAERRKLLGLEG